MIVRINGADCEVKAADLVALLAECGYDDPAAVATAHNKTFIRRKDRAAVRLAPGDDIEILTPRQGG